MDALQATAPPAIAFDRAVRELQRYQRRPVQDDEGDDGGDGSALGPVPLLDELVSVFARGSGVSMRLVDPAVTPDPADEVPWTYVTYTQLSCPNFIFNNSFFDSLLYSVLKVLLKTNFPWCCLFLYAGR